jgi:hypothetical protein
MFHYHVEWLPCGNAIVPKQQPSLTAVTSVRSSMVTAAMTMEMTGVAMQWMGT